MNPVNRPASQCLRVPAPGRTIILSGGEPRPITKFCSGFSTSGWDVLSDGREWVLRRESENDVTVCPAEWPQGLAIDAALEYMDRVREENIPRWCQSPEDLMRFCAGEARKQR